MLRDEYEIFIEGVRRLCGIDLSSYKRPQMERRIRSFADHQKITSLEAYLKVLQGDATALDRQLMTYLNAWNNTTAPQLQQFGEPALTNANRADAMRTQWLGQSQLTAVVTMPPITLPGASNDPVGTFGPRVVGNPGIEDPKRTNALLSDYVVDLYDCQRLNGLGTPGAQVNQGGSVIAKLM